jgi:hypothetical protein
MSADSATHEAKVTIKNHGLIPTALEQAKRVKAVPEDMLTIEGPRGTPARMVGRPARFHVGGRETKTVTIRLRVPAGTDAVMNARVTSTRGGISDHEVRVPR